MDNYLIIAGIDVCQKKKYYHIILIIVTVKQEEATVDLSFWSGDNWLSADLPLLTFNICYGCSKEPSH